MVRDGFSRYGTPRWHLDMKQTATSTLSPSDRFANHRRKAEWWPLVDESKTTIEWFSSRSRARQHELRAIRNEHPIFNKEGVLQVS